MKTQDILLVAGVAALGFFGYQAYKKSQVPPIPPEVQQQNPYASGSNKAQTWLMWISALLAAGTDMAQAILSANQKTEAGETPRYDKDGKLIAGIGCATCNLPYSIGCSAGCACEQLQHGELPTVL